MTKGEVLDKYGVTLFCRPPINRDDEADEDFIYLCEVIKKFHEKEFDNDKTGESLP